MNTEYFAGFTCSTGEEVASKILTIGLAVAVLVALYHATKIKSLVGTAAAILSILFLGALGFFIIAGSFIGC